MWEVKKKHKPVHFFVMTALKYCVPSVVFTTELFNVITKRMRFTTLATMILKILLRKEGKDALNTINKHWSMSEKSARNCLVLHATVLHTQISLLEVLQTLSASLAMHLTLLMRHYRY